MTKKKKTIILISCLLLIFILGIGGKKYMDSKRFHEEMLVIVKSDEAKKVFEEGLRNLDSKALTSEGIIKSYEIDEESVKHNPMGGIMFTAYFNRDNQLYLKEFLNKYNNSLESGGSALSPKLSKLLRERMEVNE
ncbi:DUF1310 family protein [Enterococcus faecalis]|uniref:DUF1310 family protein n=1 Tax=Enterococcus faecalis TaxID=1351 RepID=UPI0029368575|nr:DUF1310 family protein [Enterococcus faecalis]MDV2933130.1 DUF1310 family protein [Enterococcus faecalis]